MSTLILDKVLSGYNLAKVNDNFERIEKAFNEALLHRDGSKELTDDLDVNSQKLLNVGGIEIGGVDIAESISQLREEWQSLFQGIEEYKAAANEILAEAISYGAVDQKNIGNAQRVFTTDTTYSVDSILTLPLPYIVGKNTLKLNLNHYYEFYKGVDYEEVGVVGSTSTSIKLLRTLSAGVELEQFVDGDNDLYSIYSTAEALQTLLTTSYSPESISAFVDAVSDIQELGLEDKIEQLNTQYEQLVAYSTALQTTVADINTKYSTITDMYEDMGTKYSLLETLYPQLLALLSDTNFDLDDLNTAVGDLNDAIDDLEDLVPTIEGYADTASEAATNASNSATSASGSATAAATSASSAASANANAQIWAEGTDSQVEYIGGEHSAKGWAEVARDFTFGNLEEALSYTVANDSVVVKHTPQSLTNDQKAQARSNIGAQASLSSAQISAINSGITSSKVSTYDAYASNKVSKSGDTMTGTLNINAAGQSISMRIQPNNIDLSQEKTASHQFLLFQRNPEDTTNTSGNIGQILANQSGHDLDLLLRVADPRRDNRPNAGTDINTSTCWSGIGIHYDYAKNKGYASGFNLTDWNVNDSNANHMMSTSLATTRRSCYVGMSGGQVASPWFKVGTYTTTTTSTTTGVCLFDVASTNWQFQRGGQLRVVFRLDANRVINQDATKLEWVTAYGDLNTEDFVLLFNSGSSSITLDLYVRCNKADLRYTFKVLSEKVLLSGNSNAQSIFFTLANNVSNGSLAALPSGTKIVSSSKKEIKYGKRIGFITDQKFPDHDAAIAQAQTIAGVSNLTYWWPQAVGYLKKGDNEYLYFLNAALPSDCGVTCLTVYDYKTGEYLRYHMLPDAPLSESIVLRTEGNSDYIYTRGNGNILKRFQLNTTNGSILTSSNRGNESVRCYYLFSYRNGTWMIWDVQNQTSSYGPPSFVFYDDNFNNIGQWCWQRYQFDTLSNYNSGDADQLSIPHLQGITLGDDGIYFHKGGSSNITGTWKVSDIGIEHYSFRGEIIKTSVCKAPEFLTKMNSLLGWNKAHSECESGFIDSDGNIHSLIILGERNQGISAHKMVILEDFSTKPDAIDFSDCLANYYSNVPYKVDTPQFPKGRYGKFWNPFTGALLTCLDDVIVMMYKYGLDHITLNPYGLSLNTTDVDGTTVVCAGQDWTKVTKHKSENNSWVTDGTFQIAEDDNFVIEIQHYRGNVYFCKVLTPSSTSSNGASKQFTVTIENNTVKDAYLNQYEATFFRSRRLYLGTETETPLPLWNHEGNLQWNSKDVVVIVASGTGWKRFSDGTQECWGRVRNSSADGMAVTYPKAFSERPYTIAGIDFAGANADGKYSVITGNATATGFTAKVAYNNTATANGVDVTYFARGTWSAS